MKALMDAEALASQLKSVETAKVDEKPKFMGGMDAEEAESLTPEEKQRKTQIRKEFEELLQEKLQPLK